MGLSIPGYGIHGTIAPTSIYRFRTHGCIRLHADDIAALFSEIAPGTAGLIIYQPLLVARLGSQLFLEVHRDVCGKEAKMNNLESVLDWEAAKEIIGKQEGVARDVTAKITQK
jgi:L,D-transpeptidase ErfK/SrfK